MAYDVFASRLPPCKWFEQSFNLIRSHTSAFVLDLSNNQGLAWRRATRGTVVLQTTSNMYRAFALEFDCVREDIDQNLLESTLVELYFAV